MKSPHEMSAIVVEDQDEMRGIIRAILHNMSFHHVFEADNGEIALEIIKQQSLKLDTKSNIGVVVADWTMPKMTGLDLLKCLKNDPNLSSIIFLMVTGEDSESSVVNAIAHGVSDYIVKPFSRISLEKKILTLLKDAN